MTDDSMEEQLPDKVEEGVEEELPDKVEDGVEEEDDDECELPDVATEEQWSELDELIAPMLKAGWLVDGLFGGFGGDAALIVRAELVSDGMDGLEVHVEVDDDGWVDLYLAPLDWEEDQAIEREELVSQSDGGGCLFKVYEERGWLVPPPPARPRYRRSRP